MIGRTMHWLLDHLSPKARKATEAVCESHIMREEKRSAVSRLVAALETVEDERAHEHLSRPLSLSRHRNGHAD